MKVVVDGVFIGRGLEDNLWLGVEIRIFLVGQSNFMIDRFKLHLAGRHHQNHTKAIWVATASLRLTGLIELALSKISCRTGKWGRSFHVSQCFNVVICAWINTVAIAFDVEVL